MLEQNKDIALTGMEALEVLSAIELILACLRYMGGFFMLTSLLRWKNTEKKHFKEEPLE